MFSKIKNFFKNKKGSDAITAILIVPVWLLLLSFIGSKMQIKQAENQLADSSQIVTRYLMNSETLDEGIKTANDYLSRRSDARYYDKIQSGDIVKIAKLSSSNSYDIVQDKTAYSNNWKSGNMVTIKLSRKTPFSDSSALKFCMFSDQDNCLTIVNEKVYVTMTFIINNDK